jgi:hypothetical protein
MEAGCGGGERVQARLDANMKRWFFGERAGLRIGPHHPLNPTQPAPRPYAVPFPLLVVTFCYPLKHVNRPCMRA